MEFAKKNVEKGLLYQKIWDVMMETWIMAMVAVIYVKLKIIGPVITHKTKLAFVEIKVFF